MVEVWRMIKYVFLYFVFDILELMINIIGSLEILFFKIKIEYGYDYFICYRYGWWYKILFILVD